MEEGEAMSGTMNIIQSLSCGRRDLSSSAVTAAPQGLHQEEAGVRDLSRASKPRYSDTGHQCSKWHLSC